jgi:hypothetical protein
MRAGISNPFGAACGREGGLAQLLMIPGAGKVARIGQRGGW